MKTRFATSVFSLTFCLFTWAQPRVMTVMQTEDSQTKEIVVSQTKYVEILTAYDFYGAAGSIVIQKDDARFSLIPGHAAGGLPHCAPHPFVLAGPAVITVDSGNTEGARTEYTPFIVTLRIANGNAPLPKKKPVN